MSRVKRYRPRRNFGGGEASLVPKPAPAVQILAKELDLPLDKVSEALRKLVQAGYAIAPRQPTNAMFLAYMSCYGTLPSTSKGMLHNLSKARIRWEAMATVGTALALSVNQNPKKQAEEPEAIAARVLGLLEGKDQ